MPSAPWQAAQVADFVRPASTEPSCAMADVPASELPKSSMSQTAERAVFVIVIDVVVVLYKTAAIVH